MAHVFEPEMSIETSRGMENFFLRGKWAQDFFKNNHPIVLELGCGRGDYAVTLAERFPDQNFIGVDVKGSRIWHGATAARDKGLKNVAFLRARAQNLSSYFSEGEVSEIWLTFPDPFPPEGKEKKRLTSSGFLKIYREILMKEGILHLKHDNPAFFDYSAGIIPQNEFELVKTIHDLYGEKKDESCVDESLLRDIQTTYEKRHLSEGRQIFYLKAGAC